MGKVITHFSSRRVARIPPPPEVTAPFRRDSNDPGRSCGRGNGDGEGSGASGGGRWGGGWGGGWRAPPRATGPGAGAAHCWALRGAATRRARAGRHSRCRRWTRAGGVRGRVHLQGPACAAGRDRGRVCASDSGAPDKACSWRGRPRPPRGASTPVRADQAVDRRAESPTRRTPASGPIAHRYRSAAERCSNHPERHRAPAARHQATTRITGTGHRLERLAQHALNPAPAPLGHCPHHLGRRHAGGAGARSGPSGAVAR